MARFISSLKRAWEKSFFFKMIQKRVDHHFQKRLVNENFTILCPNCIGGCIYHRLGKKFLSPTINMWLTQPDFVTFLLHLDDYIAQPLCFVESVEKTPVAKIGGVTDSFPEIYLHFNHAKNSVEAEELWNRRKARINKNNLYVILYNLDGVTEEQIHLLDNYPCKNKIVLSQTALPDIPWSKYIKRQGFGQFPDAYLGKDIFGIRYIEKKWDYVSFLNQV